MTKVDIVKDMKIILSQDPDFLKPVVQQLLQEFLEAEMAKTIGADAYKRCDDRTGYRSGYYSRQLVTRVGTMQLRVPRDREGKFSTQLFERYLRWLAEVGHVLTKTKLYFLPCPLSLVSC